MVRMRASSSRCCLGLSGLSVDEDDAADDAAGGLHIVLHLGLVSVILARLPGEEVRLGVVVEFVLDGLRAPGRSGVSLRRLGAGGQGKRGEQDTEHGPGRDWQGTVREVAGRS